jgi:16S rRNA (guanine527-N7)-methyltransferase
VQQEGSGGRAGDTRPPGKVRPVADEPTPPTDDPVLSEVLAESRELGFLGPGPVADQLRHARGFAEAFAAAARTDAEGEPPPGPGAAQPATLVDLGSGGGVPGLVLARIWPQCRVALLEVATRRAGFLRKAIERLDCGDRVVVIRERAEVAGREPALRGRAQLVTARSFGGPATTAECAAPFLHSGGLLLVSEPPQPPGDPPAPRWPAEGLAQLGLADEGEYRTSFGFRILRSTSPCPERFPRRNGVPANRPLF